MKIFFFGGSFDPPHKGHKSIAEFCIKNNLCDKFLFIPTKKNPLKSNPFFSVKDRLYMLQIITNSINEGKIGKVEVDTYEIKSSKKESFTIDTVNYLLNKYKNDEIFMVVGKDILKNLEKWKKWDEIQSLVKLVCVNRSEYESNSFVDIDCMIEEINFNIDSTYIRKKIMAGDFSKILNKIPSEILKHLKKINNNNI